MDKIFDIENGNARVILYEDGTRVVETLDPKDDYLDLKQPLSLDINISNRCSNNCPYCYAGNTPKGKTADLMNMEYLNDVEGIEVAINIQFPLPDFFEEWLMKMRDQGIVVNGTLNQIDFERDPSLLKYIKTLQEKELLRGVGVSHRGNNNELEDSILNNLSNVVIHTIVGITPVSTVKRLLARGFKVLILGYKEKERGIDYINNVDIDSWKSDIKEILRFKHKSVLSFDTAAIKQLGIKDLVSADEWKRFYQGDEGTISFYIDAVNRTFNVDSHTLDEPFSIDDISSKKMLGLKKAKPIEQMFKTIKDKVNHTEEG